MNIRASFVLTGTLGYFLLTYLFYTAMAIFNELFMLYVVLLCCSFFAFLLTLIVQSFDLGLFLSLLMASLTSKILFMAHAENPVIPAIFVIPTILIVALVFSGVLLANITVAK